MHYFSNTLGDTPHSMPPAYHLGAAGSFSSATHSMPPAYHLVRQHDSFSGNRRGSFSGSAAAHLASRLIQCLRHII